MTTAGLRAKWPVIEVRPISVVPGPWSLVRGRHRLLLAGQRHERVERLRIGERVPGCRNLRGHAAEDPLERDLELLAGKRAGYAGHGSDAVRHMARRQLLAQRGPETRPQIVVQPALARRWLR